MRPVRRTSVRSVVRPVSLPKALPSGPEQTASELARMTFERSRLVREIDQLDQKRGMAARMLAKVDHRLGLMLAHLHGLVTDPAEVPKAAPEPPRHAPIRPKRNG